MKNKLAFLIGLLLLCHFASCQIESNDHSNPTETTWLYLGQTPPDTIPQLFAPGIVSSTDMREFSGCFSSDGKEYFFYRFSQTTPAKIYFTRVVNEIWTEPQPVDVTSGYPAFHPYITKDNNWLLFSWFKSDIMYYSSKRSESGWESPQLAGQGMFITQDSLGQFYIGDMSSRMVNGKTYIAKVTFTDGKFTNYQRVKINSYYGSQTHPCVALDGSYMIFDIDSGNHLFVSFKDQDGNWSDAMDLAQHGFDEKAGGAYLSPDGKYLFFSLNGDIYWVSSKIIERLRPID